MIHNQCFLNQLHSGFVWRHYWCSKSSKKKKNHLALTETLQVTQLPHSWGDFFSTTKNIACHRTTVWEKVKWKFLSVNKAVKSHRDESANMAAVTLPWKATPLITHLHCTTCERHAHLKLNEVCSQWRLHFSTLHPLLKKGDIANTQKIKSIHKMPYTFSGGDNSVLCFFSFLGSSLPSQHRLGNRPPKNA